MIIFAAIRAITEAVTTAAQTEQTAQSPQILGQNLENLIRPYVGYITFAIDVSAGIIIGISAIMALIAFFKILTEPTEKQTELIF